jgi:hypothetical protein
MQTEQLKRERILLDEKNKIACEGHPSVDVATGGAPAAGYNGSTGGHRHGHHHSGQNTGSSVGQEVRAATHEHGSQGQGSYGTTGQSTTGQEGKGIFQTVKEAVTGTGQSKSTY